MKKIGYLKDFKVNAQVVDCGDIGTDVVKFVSYVKIVDLDNDRIKNIRIVGDYEADINKGLVYKTALSNQKRNYSFFEYPSFADEQLFDRVSNTATQCDNKYINAVFLTADSKGIRTRISCYSDDLGQK